MGVSGAETVMPEIITLRARLAAMMQERSEIAGACLDEGAIARLMQMRHERLALSGRLMALEARIYPTGRSCAHD